MEKASYRQLDGDQTIATLQTLRNRITERFGDSSLSRVAGELCEVAGESRSRIVWIDRPQIALRGVIFMLVLGCCLLAGLGVNELLRARSESFGFADTIGLLESVINEVIIVGAALAFLFSLELRVKRTRALKALHDLRAIAHVIDMHQLTKDPSQILIEHPQPTQSSPKRLLTPFLLTRYLDYCSEMLSMIGKLAALYAQSLSDPIVVGAVNDIETLTNGLSRKIWQKIVMLDDVARVVEASKERERAAESEPTPDGQTVQDD